MRYHNIEEGVFLKRPNRFIAVVRLKGEEVVCHGKIQGGVGNY